MDSLGRVLIVLGIAMILLGVLFLLGRHLPFLGQLPGDLHFERKGVRLVFPLATCLLISLVLTAILNLIFRR